MPECAFSDFGKVFKVTRAKSLKFFLGASWYVPFLAIGQTRVGLRPTIAKLLGTKNEERESKSARKMARVRPVQTSCFCRAELNSGIKFDKSTAEARRLNQTFELSSASN